MEKDISSTTRAIWSSTENIMIIFVGSAADFALNSENDWLFFTNSLPSNPEKRFVDTFLYNGQLLFMSPSERIELGKRIRNIHSHVEKNRSSTTHSEMRISNKAFKEVGAMLVEYGIKGYEFLHKKTLSASEKDDYYQDLRNLFSSMSIAELEETYEEFALERARSINEDLQVNKHTQDLYDAYRKDLGWFKYQLFVLAQSFIVDPIILNKLSIRRNPLLTQIIKLFPYINNSFTADLLQSLLTKKETKKALDAFEAKVKAIHKSPLSQ